MSVRERIWPLKSKADLHAERKAALKAAGMGKKQINDTLVKEGLARKAWVVDYVDQTGKRHIETFQKKKQAAARHDEVRVDVREGVHVPDSASVTVKEAGELWIASAKEEGLERGTLLQYRQHLDLHIVPFIGRTRLSQLSVPAIRSFRDKLRTEGRSPSMVRKVLVSLGSILADAGERGLVAHNAVSEMRRKRRKERQAVRRQKSKLEVGVDIPTREEIKAIVENVKERWRPLILTAIFTGLRASELRGLRWADVDLNRRELHVRQRADRFNQIGLPKSEAGQRTVPLPPLVANTLKEWKLACPKGDLDLVFPTGSGNVENLGNITKRGFVPAQLAGGVTDDDGNAKYTGFHCLRHFYASWCINRTEDGGLGLPPKVVQTRMGHSSITLTMDRYGHLFPSGDDGEELAKAELSLLA